MWKSEIKSESFEKQFVTILRLLNLIVKVKFYIVYAFDVFILLFTVNQCYYILLECYSFVNWGENSRSILYH